MRKSLAVVLLVLIALVASAQARDTVTIVCEDGFAPWGYRGQHGQAAGFSTDVIREAYDAMGVDVRFKVMPYARCMDLVLEGVEVGCYNTNNDSLSLANYIMPEEPLFIGEMTLWARSDFTGRVTVEDLIRRDEAVGVTLGYNYDAPGVSFDYNDAIRKDPAPSVRMTLHKLVVGRYRFAAVEKMVARLVIRQNPELFEGEVHQVGLISRPGLYLSFSKVHPDGQRFSDLLDQGIRALKASGRYQELERKWEHLVTSGTLP